jgi:hypothetical protein
MDAILVAALDVERTKVPPTDPPPHACAHQDVERRLEHGLNRPVKVGPSARHQLSSRVAPTPPRTGSAEG